MTPLLSGKNASLVCLFDEGARHGRRPLALVVDRRGRPEARLVGRLRAFGLPFFVAAALIALVVNSLSVFPHSRSYFNRLASGPELQLSTSRLDLGDGRPNQILSGEIQLKNAGRAPLEFSIASSCGCQDVAPRQGTIPPGGELALSVSLKLAGYSGSEKSEWLKLKSNDPQRPELTCTVVARAPAPFEVMPAFVNFGKVVPNDVATLSADVRVKLPAGEQRPLRARLRNQSFSASREAADVVRLRPAGALGFGNHYDTLELFLEGAEQEAIRVPLNLHVSAPLSTVPSTLFLRNDSDGRFRAVDWILMSNDRRSPLDKITVVNAPPEFRIEELGRIGDHRRRYRLTVKQGWHPPGGRFVLELEESSTQQRCSLQLISSKR